MPNKRLKFTPLNRVLCEIYMRNILLNTWLLIFLAVAVGSGSLIVSYCLTDFSWFSRSGSAITVIGLLLTIKNTILSTSRDLTKVVLERNNYSLIALDPDSPKWREKLKEAKRMLFDEYCGLFLTILGTAVWGYGDLLGKVIT